MRGQSRRQRPDRDRRRMFFVIVVPVLVFALLLLIVLLEKSPREESFRNVLLEKTSDGSVIMVLGSEQRRLTYRGDFPGMTAESGEKSTAEESASLPVAVADITVRGKRITDAAFHTDTCEGRILSLDDGAIEVEGVGTIEIDDSFRVYRVYGTVAELSADDMLVGYDLGKIVISDGRAVAALISHRFTATNIRVLITTDDFSSIFHDVVVLSSDGGMEVSAGGEMTEIGAGEKYRVEEGDEILRKGRLRIAPKDPAKPIRLLSINRQEGNPLCPGTIEISEEGDGLILLNDLDLESYLMRVVPSEMLPTSGMEALKAQAICARTYAWRQILANAYHRYGAHVDDSTSYQVYNNIQPDERTDEAVRETAGLMVWSGREPAETYYFSTSCGYTTDMSVWGDEPEKQPYLVSHPVAGESGTTAKKLTDEDNFRDFIEGSGEDGYDSGKPMYRWTTEISGSFAESRVTGIGEIQGFFVTKRSPGGSATEIEVVGSEGSKYLRGADSIRRILGDSGLIYRLNGGSIRSGFSILPSAFIYIDQTAQDPETGERTFTIWGGGFGHGVGMSQSAAAVMADEGKDFREILGFFYPGTVIRTSESG